MRTEASSLSLSQRRKKRRMALLPVIVMLLLSLFFSSAASAVVSREFFDLEGDVAWVVQVSDLHISAYHRDRAEDLVTLLVPALQVIRPSLLLITGDITDAKTKRRTTSRQDESEWIQYRETMDVVISQSGLEKRRVFDIRGNHDMYGVPFVGGKLDFFSKYSISSQLSRNGTIQSISLVGNERKYMFLGIDNTMSIGLRGPSNLFGHPTQEKIDAAEVELHYWDKHPGAMLTKVVFGHYPMSFTASSEKGERYEHRFVRQSVSAYICGHLHATFGKQLWRLHIIELASGPKESKNTVPFWEWELGDWKVSRFVRILAIDRGEVSFKDIELSSKHEPEDVFRTAILITYPTDSRNMNRIKSNSKLFRNDINALVFSLWPILNVTAKVFDSSRSYQIVEEVPLQLDKTSAINKPLFHAKWNAENYRSSSADRYWLQVIALNSQGKESASELRPFSVEGKLAPCPSTLISYLVFHVQFEKLYSFLLWSNICFLALLLFLPKLLNYFMERNSSYQRWAMSVSVSSPVRQRKTFFWVLWFLIEGSRSRKLWLSLVIYSGYLLFLPWFWGHATSENGDIGKMYMFGWSIQTPDGTMRHNLGIPDILPITLPFMYLVVTPMVLLFYSLSAERSAVCFHKSRQSHEANTPINESGQGVEFDSGTKLHLPRSKFLSGSSKIFGGWTRRAILLACLIVMLIHFLLCSYLMKAYGAGLVVLSPALLWTPPLFLAATIYLTTITSTYTDYELA